MSFFASHVALRRSLALLLAFTLSACTAWRPAVGNPDALIAGQPHVLRVILLQGDTLVLHSPTLRGDTVSGVVRRGVEQSPTTVLLGDIALVEVQQPSAGGLILVGLSVALVIMAVTSFHAPSGSFGHGCIFGCGQL